MHVCIFMYISARERGEKLLYLRLHRVDNLVNGLPVADVALVGVMRDASETGGRGGFSALLGNGLSGRMVKVDKDHSGPGLSMRAERKREGKDEEKKKKR